MEKKVLKKKARATKEESKVDFTILADTYGALAEQKKEIEKQMEELRKRILEANQSEIKGRKYRLAITEEWRVDIDTEKAYDLLDIETFIRVVTVSTSKFRSVVTPAEFEDCVAKRTLVKKINVASVE